jgi:hypothetical protein
MSISKVEHWEIGWNEGRRPRSRRFEDESDARAFARELGNKSRRRPRTRKLDRWQVRSREGGRGSRAHMRTFERKRDAERFEREVKRRKELGELALWEQRNRSVHELAREWWAKYAVPNLAELTLDGYEPILAKHVVPRLGEYRLGDVTPEVVADFRAQLESAGVGRHAVRVSMVVLQAMFKQAIRWRWIEANPVKAVEKPSGKRERAVVCLAPAQVEAIRAWLIKRDKLYAATIVSLVAYQGLRIPEEVLALEVRHVRANTLLIEQRNIKGKIVPGQKVRHSRPRSPRLLDPVRRDVAKYLMSTGIREGTAVSPAGRRAMEGARLQKLDPPRLEEGPRGRRDRIDAALRPTTCVRLAPDPSRRVDPRAGRGARPLAADDRGHLHPRHPRASGAAGGVGGGPDRARANRCAARPRGERLNRAWSVGAGRQDGPHGSLGLLVKPLASTNGRVDVLPALDRLGLLAAESDRGQHLDVSLGNVVLRGELLERLRARRRFGQHSAAEQVVDRDPQLLGDAVEDLARGTFPFPRLDAR